MEYSRLPVTHVGSLPRSAAVTDIVFARESGKARNATQDAQTIAEAVRDCVTRQDSAGISWLSDGEMSKISYATYVTERLNGFAGDSPRSPPGDLAAFPGYMKRLAAAGGTPSYRRPRCVGPVTSKTQAPLAADLKHFADALAQLPGEDEVRGFMNAAAPGVIALFLPNDYYPSPIAYLQALADAMRPEYEAIVAAGFDLQIDAPDLGLGRHMMAQHLDDDAFVHLAHQHVDALNAALVNIPPEKVRLHVCWGNYEGPHHCDAPMHLVAPIAFRVNAQTFLFEAANPRHAHEWAYFRDTPPPEDKILAPGVIDTTTNFIEHPDLIAERLLRFASIVGRERIVANTDCGFSSFAGFGAVDPAIAYAKLESLGKGAAIARRALWQSDAK